MLHANTANIWIGDPLPAATIVAVSCWYWAGARRHRGRRVADARARWFAAAMVVLAVALTSPLEPLSDTLFTAHMVQHLLIAAVAPPLLVLGAPEHAMLLALPSGVRRAAGRVARRMWVKRLWRIATLPFVACLLHGAAIWSWHIPSLYQRALRDDGAHAIEHLSFLITGVLLWWSILRPNGDRQRGYGIGIVMLFATAMHTGALGALFAFSRRVLYTVQSSSAPQWGLTPLDDQQLAGMVMWIFGGVLYMVAMSVLFVAWLQPPGRRRAMRGLVAASAAATSGLTGCGRAQASVVAGGDPQRGKEAIVAMGCGACHVVSGIPDAHGDVGPPLAGVASRAIIGGVLPNTPANMMAWIEDAPSFAPRTAMPNLGVTPEMARDIVAYLYARK